MEGRSPEERDSSAVAYFASLDHLNRDNPEIVSAIVKELEDQRTTLKLIASENYSSLATQLAMGNLMTDKYSEGYPFHRFYAGCENVDTIEALAVLEAKKLFGAEHAYVQPHSGSDANLVAYWSILVQRVQNREVEALHKKSIDELSPEEYEKIRQLMLNQKVMGLALDAGGHLTHGYRHNVSAKMMRALSYGVDPETQLIDYKALEEQVKRERPTILIGGYSSYPRLLNFAKMREIADSVDAVLLVDMAHFAGLVAGRVLTGENNPIPYAHIITSTTHKTLRGPRGGLILCGEEFKEVVDKGCPLVLGGPLPHVMAAKAVAFREANQPSFELYAKQVVLNAQAFAERLLSRGVKLFTGGTDNHLVVLDVKSSFTLTGRQAEIALRGGLMTVNRNTIPNDTNGAWYTSGVRIGTPALTTRGLKESEMREIADLMVDLLQASKAKVVERTGEPSRAKVDIDAPVLERVRREVEALLSHFPLYPELFYKE
ncbi:MAG: Serine hydroxymethyltransferase [Chlamydiae bacterium]|nr:Serine hydroxymethyltransferase [Chlamydiota bacterium]